MRLITIIVLLCLILGSVREIERTVKSTHTTSQK